MRKKVNVSRIILLFFVSVLGFSVSGFGQKAIKLKFNPPVGDKKEGSMKMNMTMTMMGMEMPMDMTFAYNQTVSGKSNEGTSITQAFNHITMNSNMMGMEMKYDSKSPDESMPELVESMDPMIGKEFTLVIDENGETKKTEGLEQLGGGNEQLSSQALQNYTTFPSKPIKVGDTWKNKITTESQGAKIIIDATYKLEKVKSNIAYISIEGDMALDGDISSPQLENANAKLKGKQTGTLEVHIPTGYVQMSEIIQNMDMTMDAMGQEMEMKIITTITTTLK